MVRRRSAFLAALAAILAIAASAPAPIYRVFRDDAHFVQEMEWIVAADVIETNRERLEREFREENAERIAHGMPVYDPR